MAALQSSREWLILLACSIKPHARFLLGNAAHTGYCRSSHRASDVSAGGCPRVLRHQCALCIGAVPHPRSAACAHVCVQAGAQVGAAVAVSQEHTFARPGPMPVRRSSSDAQLATPSRNMLWAGGAYTCSCLANCALATSAEECCSQSIHGAWLFFVASAIAGS